MDKRGNKSAFYNKEMTRILDELDQTYGSPFLDDDTAGGSNADVNTSVIGPLVTALGVSLDTLTVA